MEKEFKNLQKKMQEELEKYKGKGKAEQEEERQRFQDEIDRLNCQGK